MSKSLNPRNDVVEQATRQAQALFPLAQSQTLRAEVKKHVLHALKEARQRYPANTRNQMSYVKGQVRIAIQDKLARVTGTMH